MGRVEVAPEPGPVKAGLCDRQSPGPNVVASVMAAEQPVGQRPVGQHADVARGGVRQRADPHWQQTGTPQPETSLAATEAIRAAPPGDRRAAALGSRPAGFTSSFPGPDGRSAEPRRVMASGSTTPIEGSSLTPFRLGGVNHPNM
jgi:hypothetical protein